jgi:hypothetical protein
VVLFSPSAAGKITPRGRPERRGPRWPRAAMRAKSV